MDIFTKPDTAKWDYDVDFSRFLSDGDTITEATAVVLEADSMVSIPLVTVQPDTVKVWLVDGVAGKTATIEVTATTQFGRIDPVKFKVRIKD